MRKLLLCLPFVCGCSLFGQLAGAAFERPTLTFKEAHIDKIDFDGADVSFLYQVENKNSRSLNLAQADYKLEVEGHPVASGKPPQGLQIAGNGISNVAFPARVVWKELAPALEALFTQDAVKYKASGTLGLNTPIGVIPFPLEHDGSLSTPKLPAFELQSPKINSLTLSGARLALPLKIGNKNSFPLPLGQILGSIEIAGEKVGRMSLPAQGMVDSNQEKVIEIPLDISFFSSGLAVASAIRSGSALVKIDGTLSAAGASLPLHVAQTVTLRTP